MKMNDPHCGQKIPRSGMGGFAAGSGPVWVSQESCERQLVEDAWQERLRQSSLINRCRSEGAYLLVGNRCWWDYQGRYL